MIWRIKALVVAGWLERLSNRGLVVMNLLANSLILLLTYFFWQTFAQNSTQEALVTFTRDTLVTYTVLSVVLRSLIVNFGLTWKVGHIVRDGSITGLLIKPVSFFEYWFYKQLSGLFMTLLTLSLPLLILIGIMEPTLFVGDFYLGLFLLATILGFYLSTVLNLLMGLAAFWFESSTAFQQINIILYTVASGILVPLAMYPDWLRGVMNYLPYRGIIDAPLQMLLHGDASLLGLQLVWIVLLTVTYRLVLARGYQRLEVVGV